MLKRHYAKPVGFALCLLVPVLPFLGYQINNAWLTPILFFLVLPLLGRALPDDATPLIDSLSLPTVLRVYYRWLPRLYFPLWVASLMWAAQIISSVNALVSIILGLFVSTAIVSATASPVCHELMHREHGMDTWIARLMASLMGYPHFILEHFYHHRYVGIPDTGLSARVGESFWSFFMRAVPEGMSAAKKLDNEIRSAHKKKVWQSSLVQNRLMTLIWAIAFFWVGGLVAVAFFVFQAIFSIFSVQAINYIQHYGLIRVPGEPVSHELSWEDNCLIANCLTLNINHHSHHHLQPSRPFYELELDIWSPRLPGSYMIMLWIALVPSVWSKMMDARLITYLRQQESLLQQHRGSCLSALGEAIR
jgi:alkane 1-monooxygenase